MTRRHAAPDDPSDAESLWSATAAPAPAFPGPDGDIQAEVAIIGGGYTGLSAALHLARDHGVRAVVMEANAVGWGASGRNGGFCVPGGAKIGLTAMVARHGADEARRFFDLTLAAVGRVGALLADENIAADPRPGGELTLAHSRKALAGLLAEREEIITLHGHVRESLSPEALREQGLHAPVFFGAVREPVGFGLHPLDYVRGLARAAHGRGARILEHGPVTFWRREGRRHRLETERGSVLADKLIIATGGYPPESLGPDLAGRVLPIPSNIIATRPLTPSEQADQGWTSTQVACDSRALLHYFRLLPDGRFLFGGRGGLCDGPGARAAFRARLSAEFHRTFAAWRHVEITHFWRGMVDLAADRVPHCAVLADDPTVLVGGAYHGSGVAMATEIGAHLAAFATGREAPSLPAFMRRPPPRFPLPGLRKAYLAGAIAGYAVRDRFS
jgi:glycine/D-amino acid oxidase-like deaminating enzyme